MEKEKLTDLVVDYRVRNNLTMKQMAERCGVSLQTLFNVENEKYKVQRTTVRKILNVIENEVL